MITDPWRNLWRHRELMSTLTRRELTIRYRGSLLGVGWMVLQPLLMLIIYTFVFSVVFKARWPGATNQPQGIYYGINLFAGLIVFSFMAEVINRAPGLVLENQSYVKKVVFPLEILSVSSVVTAASSLLVGMFLVLLAHPLIGADSAASSALNLLTLPLAWLPLVGLALGSSWLLAALGVYSRDLAQFLPFFTSALLFLTPIFYSAAALPDRLRLILSINPLASIIDQTRIILVTWQHPSLTYLLVGSGLAVTYTSASLWVFNRAKKGFADVI